MPYVIEVMALGKDLYSFVERAADELNGLQDQFRFILPRQPQRAEGLGFARETYSTAEVWSFLRDQRMRLGGRRPYIVAFVDAPLNSERLYNLFGSHEGAEGLAVVTVQDAGLYVKEINRFYCYYLVRYALSFVNPSIRSHTDPGLESCYFHKKIRKAEIRASMDSGCICDRCRLQLENPPPGAAQRLSVEEIAALDKMRSYVSGQLPFSLVMKGGGVKGLAFAGVLSELESHFYFDRHVGTSAGAIAAVLLSASYKPSELITLLKAKNFSDFMDAPLWRAPFNLIVKRGMFPGESFRQWLSELLGKKFQKLEEIRMKDLEGAVVYASRPGSGTLVFDSKGERSDSPAVHAVRCSMSIPLFFYPANEGGRRVYDGGLRHNFPLATFLEENNKPANFIALYLGKRDDGRPPRSFLADMLDIVIEGDERKIVDRHIDKVIVVDTSPVGTIDFNLTELEKDFLLSLGKAAAKRFLYRRGVERAPSEADVIAAESDAEAKRVQVVEIRKKKARRRRLAVLFAGFLVILGVIAYFQ
jgi:predicted acylesterase/phospholipase RssA